MALTDNLAHYWTFDEASGNRVDEVGSVAMSATSITRGTGPVEYSAEMPRDGFLRSATNVAAAQDTSFTWMIWVYRDTGQSQGSAGSWILARRDEGSANSEYQLFYDPARTAIAFQIWNTPSPNTSIRLDMPTSSFPNNQWNQVFVWWDKAGGTIYAQVNNGTVASTGAAVTNEQKTGGLNFGKAQFTAASTVGLGGAIAEAGFWRRVLTSDERAELWNSGAGLAYPFDAGETLSIAGLSIALSLDSPSLTQAGTLAVDDTDIATTLDAVTLSAAMNLTVADLLSSVTLDSPALTQANALSVNDTDIAVTLDTPALTQAHALSVVDTDIGITLDSPTLTAAGSLSIADLLLAVAIEQPLLTQAHQLSVADMAMGVTIDGITLSTGLTLTVDGVDIALSLDNVGLTQAGVLVIQGLDIPVSVDAVTLTQAHALTVADLLSAVGLDSPELTTAGNVLAVQDAQIAVTLASPALTQSHILAVNDAVVAVTLGGITIVIPGAEVERYPRITLSRINRVTLDRINHITLSR